MIIFAGYTRPDHHPMKIPENEIVNNASEILVESASNENVNEHGSADLASIHPRLPKDEMGDAIAPKRIRIGAIRTKTGSSKNEFSEVNQAKRWVK